jgi:hypothetical protein
MLFIIESSDSGFRVLGPQTPVIDSDLPEMATYTRLPDTYDQHARFTYVRQAVRIWLYISFALFMGYIFYSPAMRYLYTYNCGGTPNPGVLVTTRWTGVFVVQALIPIMMCLMFITCYEMLLNWELIAYYRAHVAITCINGLFMLGSLIFLGVTASQANPLNGPANNNNFFDSYELGCLGVPPSLPVNNEGIFLIVFVALFVCCAAVGVALLMILDYTGSIPTLTVVMQSADTSSSSASSPGGATAAQAAVMEQRIGEAVVSRHKSRLRATDSGW